MKIPTILLSLLFCSVAVSSEIQQQKKSNGQTEKRVGVETTVKRSHVTDVEAASRNVQTKRSLEVGQQKSRSKEAGLSFQETGSAQKTSSGTDWGGLLPDAEEKDRKKQSEVSPIIEWLGSLRASKLKSNEQISLDRGPYWDSFTSDDAKYTRLDQAEKLGDKSIGDNWYMYLIPASSEEYSESLAPGRSAIIQSQQRNGQWISSGTNLRWKEGPEWSNRGKKIKNENASARWRMQKLPTSQWNTSWKKENLKEIKGNEGSRIDWKRERNSQWKNSGLNVKNWKINEDNLKKSEESSRSLEGLRNKSEKSLDSSDDKKANEEGERINKYLKHKTLYDSDPLLLLDELEHGSKYKHKGTGRYDTMLHGHKAHDKMYESNRYIGNRRGSEKVDELPEILKLKGWREEHEKMKADKKHSSKKIQVKKPSKETSDDRIKTLWSTMQSDQIQGKNDGKHRIIIINKKILEHGEDKSISSEEKKSGKHKSGGARSHMWKSNIEQKAPQRNREGNEKEENNLQKEKIAAGKSRIEDSGKQEHGPRGWKMYKPLKDSKEKLSSGDGFEVRKWNAEIPDANRHWKQNLRQQVLKTEDAGWWEPSSDHWNNKGLKTASSEQQMLGLQNIERNKHIMEASKDKELEEDSRKENEEEENIKTGRWESEKIKKQSTEIVNHGLKESDKEKPEMKDLLLKKLKSETAEKKKIQEQREEKNSEEKKTKKLEIHKPEEQGWHKKEKSEESEKKEVQVENEKKGLREIELKKIEIEKPQEQGWTIIEKPEETEKKEVHVERDKQGLGEKKVKVEKPQELGWAMIEKPEETEKKKIQVESEKKGLGEIGLKEIKVEKPQGQGWAMIKKPEETEKMEVTVHSEKQGLGEIKLKEIQVEKPQELGWAMKKKPEESEKKEVEVENEKQGLGEKEVKVEKPQEQGWGMNDTPEESEKKGVQVESEEKGLGQIKLKEIEVKKPQGQGWAMKEKPEESERKVQDESGKKGLGDIELKEMEVEKPQGQGWAMIGKPEALEKKEVQIEGEKQVLGEKEAKVQKPQEQGWPMKGKPEESEKKEVQDESEKKGLGEIELKEIEVEKPQGQGWDMIGKPEALEKKEVQAEGEKQGLGDEEVKVVKPQDQRWAKVEKPEESEKKEVQVEGEKQGLGVKEVKVRKPQEQGWPMKGKREESEKKEVQDESEKKGLGEIELKEIELDKPQEQRWAMMEKPEGTGKMEVTVESGKQGLEELELKEIQVEKPQEQGWAMIGKPEALKKKVGEVESDRKGLGEVELKEIQLEKPQEQEWAMIEKPEETEKKGIQVESEEKGLGEIKLKEIEVEKPREQGWDNKEKPVESEKKEVQVENERKGLGEIELKEIGVEKPQEREWIEKDVDAGKGKLLNSVKKELKVEGLEKNLKEEGVKMKSSKSNQSEKQSVEIGEVGLGDSKELKVEAKDVEINKSISKDSEKEMLEPEDLKGGKTVPWEEQGLETGIPKETNPGTESLWWSPERGFLWSSNLHTTEAVPDGLDEKNLPPEDSLKKESGPSVLEAFNPWEHSDIKHNEELQLPESNMWRKKGWADINIPAQKDDKESTILGKKDKNDQSLTNNKLLQKKPIKIGWAETSTERSSKSKETGSSIENTYLKPSSDLQKSDVSATKVIAKKESSEDIAISKENGLILKNSKEGEKLSKQSENNGEIWRKLNKNDQTSDNGLIKPANVKTIALEQNTNKDETMVPDKNVGQTGSLSTIGSILTGSPSSSQRSDVSSDTSVEANVKLGDVNKAIRWKGGNIAKARSAENVNNDGTAAAITNDASTGADNQDKIEVSNLHPDLSKPREATHQTVPHSVENNQHPLKIPGEESEIEILKPSLEENKQIIVAEDKSGMERLLDTGVKQDSLKEKTKEETSATDSISNQGKTLLTASKSEGNIVESEKVEEATRETEKVAHKKDENYKILEDQNGKNAEKTIETGANETGQVSSKKEAEETKEITHGLNEKGNWKQGTTELSVNKADNKVDLIKNQDKDSRKMNMWEQLSSAQDVSSKSEEEVTSKSSETIKQGSKIDSSKEWMITDKKLQTSKERQVTKSIERNDNASEGHGASSVVINQVAKEESQVEKTSEQNVAEDHLSKQSNSKVISNLSSEKMGREDKVDEEVSPTSKVSNVELKSASSTKDSVPELPEGDDIRVIKDGLRPEESDTHVWKQQKDEKEVSPNESESIKRLWDTKKASRGDVKSAEGNNVSEEKEQSSLASHALKPGKNEPWSPVLGVKSLEENDKSSWNKLNVPGDSRETKLNANEMAASNLRISAGKQLIEDNKQEVPSIISSPAALNTKTTGKARPPVANEDSIVRYLNEVVGATHTNEFESPRIEGTIRNGKLGNWAPIPLKKQQSGMMSDKKDIEIEKEETKESSKSEDIVKEDKVKNWAPIPLTKQPSLNWNNKEDIEIRKQETKGSSKDEEIIRNDQVKKWPPKPLKKQPSINWNSKGDVELEKQGIKEPSKNEEIIRNDQIKKWAPKPLAKPVSVKETSIFNVPMTQKFEKQISKEEDQKLVSDELSDEDWNTGIVDKLHPASRNFAKPLRKGVNKNEWPESWESLKSGSNKSLENDSWTETVHRMIRSLLWIIRSWRIEKTVSDDSDTKTSNAEIIKETSKESDATNLDVYVVKWGLKGPVKVAAVNNMKPSIINKLLLPRKSYEEIRESYKKNAIKNIPVAA